jgi:uncharacterized protein with HEPN domain
LVQERFSKILEAADFVGSTEGVILLDAISMRLQIIGELVKKIQKTAPMYLSDYAEIEWKKISKFRDLVSHHYTPAAQIIRQLLRGFIARHETPNATTIEAMQAADRCEGKRFDDAEALFKDLGI